MEEGRALVSSYSKRKKQKVSSRVPKEFLKSRLDWLERKNHWKKRSKGDKKDEEDVEDEEFEEDDEDVEEVPEEADEVSALDFCFIKCKYYLILLAQQLYAFYKQKLQEFSNIDPLGLENATPRIRGTHKALYQRLLVWCAYHIVLGYKVKQSKKFMPDERALKGIKSVVAEFLQDILPTNANLKMITTENIAFDGMGEWVTNMYCKPPHQGLREKMEQLFQL